MAASVAARVTAARPARRAVVKKVDILVSLTDWVERENLDC
jgi:hypothetical protein